MADQTNMKDVLEELMKASVSCYCCFDKSEDLSELDMNEAKNELEKVKEKVDTNGSKTYVVEDQSEHEISNEVVLKYIGSMIYDDLIDNDSRNGNKIDTGYPSKYFTEIVKYIKNEFDISELNGIEFDEFCRELMEMRIPFRMDIMNRICTDSNMYGVGWKNHSLIMNGNEYELFMDYIQKVWKLSELKYNYECDRVDCIIDSRYEPIIQTLYTYLEDRMNADELHSLIDRKLLNSFINEYSFDVVNEKVQSFFKPIYSPFLKDTILCGSEYDDKLREWLGNDYNMKLLYRASEHEYSGESFHECCDDKGPTLVVIKSSEGWLFGGYTTRSWSGDGIYYFS